MVLAIAVALMAIGMSLPSGFGKGDLVRQTAEELAAVLRETRSRAMRENRTYAVAFNIQNAPGSSGRILNNRSGGHWYRVLGPTDGLGYTDDAAPGQPPLFDPRASALNGADPWNRGYPIRHYLDLVSRCWIDEPHVLAKGKVRFLALTDQDNGDHGPSGGGGFYGPTYPRPWFGWWDAGSGRLRPWGGYDPAVKMITQDLNHAWAPLFLAHRGDWAVSPSGFFYEGWDGEINGSANPCDRQLPDDYNNNGYLDWPTETTTAVQLYTVYRQGEPRPLINAAWVDFAILLRPDGTASADWFRMRKGMAALSTPASIACGALGSLKGGWPAPRRPTWPPPTGWNSYNCHLLDRCHSPSSGVEASDWSSRTGFHFITLAPDATDDNDVFASAEVAVRTLAPMYRVGISRDGLVKVLPVRTSAEAYAGRSLDRSIAGTDWAVKQKVWGVTQTGAWDDIWGGSGLANGLPQYLIRPNYIGHQLNEPNMAPRGYPAVDVATPEMLRDRVWWWAP